MKNDPSWFDLWWLLIPLGLFVVFAIVVISKDTAVNFFSPLRYELGVVSTSNWPVLLDKRSGRMWMWKPESAEKGWLLMAPAPTD